MTKTLYTRNRYNFFHVFYAFSCGQPLASAAIPQFALVYVFVALNHKLAPSTCD